MSNDATSAPMETQGPSDAKTTATTTTTTTTTTTRPGGGQSGDVSATQALSGMPDWLQPGVSPGVHLILRIVLGLLNALLLGCAVMQVFSPHFEIMFLLSLGLTGSYVVKRNNYNRFVWQIEEMQRDADREKKELEEEKEKEKGEARKTQTMTDSTEGGDAGAGGSSVDAAGTRKTVEEDESTVDTEQPTTLEHKKDQ